MTRRPCTLDRPIRQEDNSKVSLSAFAFLFAEMCLRAQTSPTKTREVMEIESRLAAIGTGVGSRTLQLAAIRDPVTYRQRQLKVEEMLSFLSQRVWARWFGVAASLRRSPGTESYLIVDENLLVTRHIHPHRDTVEQVEDGSQICTLGYSSFVAGMIKGAMESCGFGCKVETGHYLPNKAVFQVTFNEQVWQRERRIKLSN